MEYVKDLSAAFFGALSQACGNFFQLIVSSDTVSSSAALSSSGSAVTPSRKSIVRNSLSPGMNPITQAPAAPKAPVNLDVIMADPALRSMMNVIIQWCQTQISLFAVAFARQVRFGVKDKASRWVEGMRVLFDVWEQGTGNAQHGSSDFAPIRNNSSLAKVSHPTRSV